MNIVVATLAAVALAEVSLAYVSGTVSALIHAAILAALLGYYLQREQSPYRRVVPVLLLLPLTRIVSLAVANPRIPLLYWHGLAGLPLLAAALLAARLLNLPRERLGLQVRDRRTQSLIALSGVPLSLLAYAILRPAPIVTEFSWFVLAVGLPGLVVFTGFLAEFIFRGLLQETLCEAMGGPRAMLYGSLLFASLHLGTLSPVYVVFIGLVGLAFAYCANKTHSIAGVALAQGLLNLGLLVVWPGLFQGLS
jgi:membrane protease YdiL (CAAX protease family)